MGFTGSEVNRSRLRATVATVARHLSRLPDELIAPGAPEPAGGLRAAWDDLVAQLALGPEPELRDCPYCGHPSMRAATRCSHCWKRLTPPLRV